LKVLKWKKLSVTTIPFCWHKKEANLPLKKFQLN
jgi:hypothetical protein